MAVADKHPSKVAMSRARHPRTGKILLATEIAEFGESWPKPLACLTVGCRARVHPVAGVPRTEKTHGRAAYFARNPSRGRANDHSAHCVYNLGQIITVLTADSGGQLRRDRTEDGARGPVYRLPWPQTFTRVHRPATGAATSPDGAVFAEQGTKLLNTAAKIAELLDKYRQMGEHPEVVFRATCNGQDVEWMYFLYTPQRAWLLARNLRRKELTHPVAVIFRPLRHRVFARDDWAWVRTDIATVDGHDGPPEMLFVSGERGMMKEVFSFDARAVSARMYIGFGMWSMVSHDSQPAMLTLDLIDGSLIAELPEAIDREVLLRWSAFRAVPE